MKNFVQPGSVVSVIAPSGGVVSGNLVKVGLLCGVALTTAAENAPVEIALEGVFTLAKTSAQAWTVGAAIYMIPATGLATTATTAGNLFIGVALAVADNPSPTGVVRLNGSAPTATT
jgi:predicted RecA/RadA family phage recombinase